MARCLPKKKRGATTRPRVYSSEGSVIEEGRRRTGQRGMETWGDGKLKKDGTPNERGTRQGAWSATCTRNQGRSLRWTAFGVCAYKWRPEIQGIISSIPSRQLALQQDRGSQLAMLFSWRLSFASWINGQWIY